MRILFAIAWLICGSSGFAYWWTKDYDLTAHEIPLFLGTSVMGPLSWVAGYCIHDHNGIIIHKRGEA